MAPDALVAFVDRLIALFNARSLDVPDGHFTRHTQWVLNGVPFEQRLGRGPDDPLILMLSRGAAGYRFTMKAVQHALPDAALRRGELESVADSDAIVLRGQGWLSGHLRGSGEPLEMLFDCELRFRGRALERASVGVDDAQLAKLQTARAAE